MGDNRTAAIVWRIAEEERAHVAVGACKPRAGGMPAAPAAEAGAWLHMLPAALPRVHRLRCLLAAPASDRAAPPACLPIAGVTWFAAVCAALGQQDPAPAFRALILELCPGLLKGPFNDTERQMVGLQRDWYDAGLWEPEQAAAASAALAAAVAAERAGQPAPAAVPPGDTSVAALAPVSDPQLLQQLAARLASMLDLEVGNARMAS